MEGKPLHPVLPSSSHLIFRVRATISIKGKLRDKNMHDPTSLSELLVALGASQSLKRTEKNWEEFFSGEARL